MIFVTVGTQLPFDRLIHAVDAWASVSREEVFAQIGPSSHRPRGMRFAPFVSPGRCRALMADADAVVAHAGMGTIIGALELGKPVIVMPRRASLGEHRNEHQLATAERLGGLGHVRVAWDESELPALLDAREVGPGRGARLHPYASDRLISALAHFINA